MFHRVNRSSSGFVFVGLPPQLRPAAPGSGPGRPPSERMSPPGCEARNRLAVSVSTHIRQPAPMPPPLAARDADRSNESVIYATKLHINPKITASSPKLFHNPPAEGVVAKFFTTMSMGSLLLRLWARAAAALRRGWLWGRRLGLGRYPMRVWVMCLCRVAGR